MSKYITKDFADINYRNPRVVKNQKKKRRKLAFVIFMLVLISVLAGVYFFLLSPYFKIQKIDITGLQNIKEDDFRNIINQELEKGVIFKHDNIFLFNIEQLEKKISDNYLLEWLDVQKEYSSKIVYIGLEEKVSSLTYLSDEKCYNIDIQGMIIEKCNHLSPNFIQIRDQSNANKSIGDQAIESDIVKYIIALNEELEGQGVNVRTYKLISRDSTDLRVLTEKGFEIYFNRSLDIKEQLIKFNILVREEIGAENLDRINYVDLRFGEKVFYK